MPPKTFIIDSETHATLKYLSGLHRRSLADELEDALQEHFKKFPEETKFFQSLHVESILEGDVNDVKESSKKDER